MSSPRLKGRENARNILCRNITIYGYCRHEKDGCLFSHEPARSNNTVDSSAQRPVKISADTTNDNLRKRLNVDSPAFTPGFGDTANGQAKVPTISPKAVSAAAFTPKALSAGIATPPVVLNKRSTEWTNHEIPEFYPQGFQASNLSDIGSSATPDPYNMYDSQYTSLEATPPTQHINPYATDTTVTTATFFQSQVDFTHPLQYHLYAPLGPHREHLLPYQRNAHDFFMSENLRQELQRKAEATLQVLPNTNLPTSIEHFHSLVPLDTTNQKSSTAFGYTSWVYKAVSSKDGHTYALRRLEGFRLTSDKAIRSVQIWKRINNGSNVSLHDCFTTRAFGDSSLVFVTDYHPVSKTLAEHHSNVHKTHRQSGILIQEQNLWTYITQLTSALKTIHGNGLAARLLSSSKILVTSKNRLRLNVCGILDVVHPMEQDSLVAMQVDDLRQLGRLVVSVATNTQNNSSVTKSIDATMKAYSGRLRRLLSSLSGLEGTRDPISDVETLQQHVADQAFSTLDDALHLEDNLYSELNQELENGRIVRLLTKLGAVNERPEFNDQNQGHNGGAWSETGERYYLKLFRDYVFHQVNGDGKPVVDLGHVLTCLNKLDAGVEEKIALVTRDEQNVLVVSYRELKRGLEAAFQDLMKAGRRM